MTNFNDYLAQQMENPDFKEEYESLEPEFAIILANLPALHKKNFQKNQALHRVISASWRMAMLIPL